MNWPAVATIVAPLIVFAIGVWSERRAVHLISYYSHVAGINGQWPNGQQAHVNTHTVVLRNAGRKAATGVRLTHASLPLFSIFPPVPYAVEGLPNGSSDVVIPSLVPGQQVTISYLYFPPMTFDQVHQGIRCDQGFATAIPVLLQRQYPRWFINLVRVVLLIGIGAVAYWLVRVGLTIWQLALTTSP